MEKYYKVGSFLKKLASVLLANILYAIPARKLKIIGVTGTDGKTTTTNLIFSILKEEGKKVGLISTINADLGGWVADTGLHTTTPTPLTLQKLLRRMVNNGLEYAVLEVTSHGLDQYRVWGIPFIAAVLTNVTNEHLDYHRTFENYRGAKAKLFRKVPLSVLNFDDPSFDFFKKIVSGKIVSYSLNNSLADFSTHDTNLSVVGISFEVFAEGQSEQISSSLVGEYNVSNCLAAVALCRSLDISWPSIKKGISNLPQLAGRFESVTLKEADFEAVVDFAHTPNALERMLKLSRTLVREGGKVLVVFGCAGLRDRQKRPVMGKIACQLADSVIITAEDPRTENLPSIISQIEQGCIAGGGVKDQNYWLIPDRRQAIRFALQKANKNDLIIISGKGHEQSMCFGKTEQPWDDREVVREEWVGISTK